MWGVCQGTTAYLQTNLRRAPWGVYVVQLDDTFTTVLPSKTSNVVGGNFSVPSQQLFLEGGGVFYHEHSDGSNGSNGSYGAKGSKGVGTWYLTSGRNGCMDPRGGDVQVWQAADALGPYT